jgi:hypothetical protein
VLHNPISRTGGGSHSPPALHNHISWPGWGRGGGGSHSLPSVPQPYLLRGGGESAGRTARPVFHNPTSCLQPACRGPEEGDNLPCAPQSPGARETQLPPCSTTLSPGRGSLSRGRGHSLPRGPQSWGTVNTEQSSLSERGAAGTTRPVVHNPISRGRGSPICPCRLPCPELCSTILFSGPAGSHSPSAPRVPQSYI